MAIIAITPAKSWSHRVAGGALKEGLSVIVAYVQRLRDPSLGTRLSGGARRVDARRIIADRAAHNGCKLG
jgi:hypothetical protein